MRASVVVPCHNAAATLAGQLEALAGQRWDGEWEVLVADNGSTDDSRAIAASFTGRLPALRVIDAGGRSGPAHARNAGAAAARGELLLFSDADDRVADGWLAALARALGEHPFAACRYEVRKLNPEWIWSRRRHPQEEGLNPYTYPPFLPHSGGSGLGVHRHLHEAVGGFDESFPALEDTDYCWRIQLAGTPLAFVPGAVVHVRFPATPGAIFRQARSYGRYNVLIYTRYRDRGMPRLGPWRGLAKLARLPLGLPRLATRPGRAAWLQQAGWRLGRIEGCFAYRAWAL